MKNRLLILIFFCAHTLVKAQIVNQQTSEGVCDESGVYYKDTENFLPQFEGTWRHVSDTMELTVKFRKKAMMPYQVLNKNCSYDFLVGEMKLVLNGLEIINSLQDLDVNHSNVFLYNLFGFSKYTYTLLPSSPEFPPHVERIHLTYNEKQNNDLCLAADFIMRIIDVNSQPQLIVKKIFTTPPCGDHRYNANQTSTSTQFYLPDGTYTCIKID
ncbi:MAG: DUF6705 family protein [Flavobacterium sp.]